MPTQISVPIPYGLTDAHRKKHTMGKTTARPRGSRERGELPLLLEQRTSRTPQMILLPILNNQSRFAPSRKSKRKYRLQVRKMTVAQAKPRRKEGGASLQERRNRVSKPSRKPQPQVSRRFGASAPDSPPTSRPALYQTMIGPGTRVGTSKYAPITIDDDDDQEEVIDREEDSPGGSSFFSSSFAPSTPSPQRTSIYAPSPSTTSLDSSSPVRRSIPSRMRGPWSSTASPASADGRYREASIYAGARTGTTSGSSIEPRSSITNQQYHSRPSSRTNVIQTPPRRPFTAAPPASGTQSISINGSRQSLVLADISDAGMRRKVADLMAVAPALSVQDLLDLLVEAEGNLTLARRQAIRASQPPPSTVPGIKSEQGVTAGPSGSARLAGYDYDGDEVMIKIDPNETFLEYDTDEPPQEASCKKGATNKHCGKNKFGAKKTQRPSKQRFGVAVKKKPARRARENSVVREFIDADNVIHLDTDFESSGTDSSTLGNSSDTEMEDAMDEEVEDLRIDVRPRYAYNSAILGRARKR